MSQPGTITTEGTGLDALKAYFGVFEDTLPHKLPTHTAGWVDEARYDAPHGILTVWSNGNWEVTFSLASVAADIKRVRGLKVTL